MQTTLYLIRHGQTKWNQEQRMQGWQNSDLTDLGKNQAILLGEKLEKEAIVFDAFYSSPSQRALETRGLINQSLQFPEYEASGLQEINMGNWEGKTYEEIERIDKEDWQRFWDAPLSFQATNQGETFEDLSLRSRESVQKMVELHQGQVIGMLSHRITIKTMVADLLGVSIENLDDVAPNSMTKIVLTDEQAILEVYSDTSHYE